MGGSKSESGTKLDRLLKELAYARRVDGQERSRHYDTLISVIEQSLAQVPLVHGLARAADLEPILHDGNLRSRQSRGRRKAELKAERLLGLPPSVYTSAGVLYPNRQAALVFARCVEEDGEVSATPWDSGHFCETQRGKLKDASNDKRRQLFQKNELSAPAYRTYLVEYVASCFSSAREYVDNKPHGYPDPLGILDSTREVSRIFEVRFAGKLPANVKTLVAVFLPRHRRRNFSEGLHEHLRALRDASVSIHYYNESQKNLRRAVRSWMRKHLDIPTEAVT